MTDTKNALEVVCISFTRIHTEYLKKSFINAARDESYKDSDENIFIDKENHTKLIDLINIDREINSGHDNISSDLQDITEKVDNYLSSLGQTAPAFIGVTGVTAFDRNKNVQKDMLLITVKNGNLQPIGIITL